jgi:hypothetical protein
VMLIDKAVLLTVGISTKQASALSFRNFREATFPP